MKKLYIIYKEKTNKMYLLMLCGLLVSGAIVCSTNGNGDANGNGNGNPLMFACTNGAAVMATADNMPTAAGEVNCASCNTDDGFMLEAVEGSDRMVCRTPYVCPNGTAESGTTSMADVENCASCNNTIAGFDLLTSMSGNEMVCRTEYVCPNGTTQSGTTSMANLENCSSCNPGFGEVMQVDGRTICQPEYVCSNGVAEIGTASMANVENCASCDFGFAEVMQGGLTVCQPGYLCANGTAVTPTEDNMPTTGGEENCASCNTSFTQTAAVGGERMTCEPNTGTNAFVCTNGRIANGTPATANVENCSSCDPGFAPEDVDSGARSICNALPIALWNAGSHQGDFGGLGFALCQNRINAGSTDTIGSDLRDRGYTKAVFFGSTNTYNFPDIGSDADALALPAMGGGAVSDRNIVVFGESSGAVSVTNTFGAPAMARTLGNVTNVAAGGGWQNGGADVVAAAGITSTSTLAWSFTNNRIYATNANCNGATRMNIASSGSNMNSTSVTASFGGNLSISACSLMQFVLCIAR